ncbi:restriction endonuclease subunit S [Lactococcus lactis]|uniref:restriction endonuclease subunit S n=1 Tax=Lactococcus lactis TaxID=1358 RepID=UPI0024A878A4|nr:restriction endonuclease subunit S [Lactococcus lactis]
MTSENNLYVEKNKAEVSKKVPELRFQGFIDAWEQHKLSDLMTFSNGINAPKENYGTGTKMISVMDILNPLPIKYDNILNSVAVDKKIEDKNKVENGDLIFVRSSEIVEEVGWAKAYKEARYALYSGFAIRGKRISSYNAYFIELTLNYANRKEIERRAGGSTRFNVSQEILNSLTVLTPSISEQNQIDLFFTKIDDTIALHQRKLDKLKLLKQGYLQQLFSKNDEEVPRVRFTNFEDKWELRKLGDNSTIVGGNAWKSSEYDPNGNYLVITISNVTGNRYIDDLKGNYINVEDPCSFSLIPNDILISLTGNVGRVSRMTSVAGVLNQRVAKISQNDEVDDEFIFQILSNHHFELSMRNLSQGAAQANISNVDVLSYSYSIPQNIKEQEKIGSFFKQLDVAIALHHSKLDDMKSIKKALLQKIFI